MSAEKEMMKAAVVEALIEFSTVDGNKQPDVDAAGHRKLNTNMSATLEVNLDPANDGVEIYGSSDGGATQTVIKTDAGGAVQVDIEGALPAGTNNIGDVDIASIAAGDNNIGNVDIASFPSGTETPTASTATDSTGSPVAAGKLCVTFTTSAGFAGTILGEARNPSTTYVFEAKTPGKTLAAIAYTVIAGSMTIDVQS